MSTCHELNPIFKSFSALIFDFDGVVMDTESLHFKAWNKGFATLGNTLTEAEYQPLKSTGRANIVSVFATKLGREITNTEAANICKIKDEYFKILCEKADKALLINGVEAFLKNVKAAGIKTAVASSASTTTELIKKVGLTPYFDEIVDGNMGLPKKPKPDIFLAAASKLCVKPRNALVFEDSQAGIAASLNAGIPFVAVGGITHEKALICIKDFASLN